MNRTWSRTLAAGALLATHPLAAWACPACFAASSPRVLDSYLLTAALLTVLPFTIVGAGVAVALYVRRHSPLDAGQPESVDACR